MGSTLGTTVRAVLWDAGRRRLVFVLQVVVVVLGDGEEPAIMVVCLMVCLVCLRRKMKEGLLPAFFLTFYVKVACFLIVGQRKAMIVVVLRPFATLLFRHQVFL